MLKWVRLKVAVNNKVQAGARTFLSAFRSRLPGSGQDCPRSGPTLLIAPPALSPCVTAAGALLRRRSRERQFAPIAPLDLPLGSLITNH
jgi:hypothetical protein